MNGCKTPRRRFVQMAAAAAGGVAAGCANRKGAWRFLSIEEARTVTAIAERLIPADQDPGAAWTGVTNFIDLQLVGPYRRFQKRYRQGLLGVDHASEHRFGKRFIELTAAQQDELLAALERGDVPPEVWQPGAAKQFFELMLAHAMQGFYGDPRHGGNHEAASWRMLGVPVVPVRGRQGGKLA